MARAKQTSSAISNRLQGQTKDLKQTVSPKESAAVIEKESETVAETVAEVTENPTAPEQDAVAVELQEPKPETVRGPGRPRKETTIREPGNRKGLQPGQERFTVVGETELLNELRDYAYTERITLKAALDRSIRFLLKSEKERGLEILKRPQ